MTTDNRAPVEAPYGAWASPLSAARATAGALRLGQIALDGDDVYWLEGRASEGGRNVLVRASVGAPPVDVSPPSFDVRSRVHEYGGAAYAVHQGRIYASNFADQRLYDITPGRPPQRPHPGRLLLRAVPHRQQSPAAGLHPRGPYQGRRPAAGGGGRGAARRGGAVGRHRAGAGRRLLLRRRSQPRRPATRLAAVAPSAHAVGRHRALRRRPRRHRPARRAGARGRRRRRVGVPAGVVGRRRSCTSCRIAPAGGTCIASTATSCGPDASDRRPSSASRSGASARPPMPSRPTSQRGRDLRAERPVADGAAVAGAASGRPARPWPLEPLDSVVANGRAAYFVGGSATEGPAIVRVSLAAGGSRDRQAVAHRHPRRRAGVGAGGHHLRQRRPGRARLLLPAGQSRLPRPGRHRAAAARAQPRRADRRDLGRVRSRGAVLDHARVRGGRRELRRQHRLRPRLSASG